MSSNWRKTSMIWVAYMSLSSVFEGMSLSCLLTIYGLIGLVLCCTCIDDNQIIKEFLHVEHSNLFLDAQLQLQPIQPGKHAVCELWNACVCHHIKNGWGRDMTGHLWFVRTTTDVVQTTTPNWLTTRDIWWSVSAELDCRPDITETCLPWWHVADMSPTLSTKQNLRMSQTLFISGMC